MKCAIRPIHPGEIIRKECLDPLGLSVTDAARALGVNRLTLSHLVNKKNGVSPEMACRLEKVFGGSAKIWLGLQQDYDLSQVQKQNLKGLTRVKPPKQSKAA